MIPIKRVVFFYLFFYFVEPFLPHNKIRIMHLAAGLREGKKDMRLNKDIKINIKSTSGKEIKKSLRFGLN